MAGTAVLACPCRSRPVQILYVNLATDGLPALALAVDPPDDDLSATRRATRARAFSARA